MIRRGLMHWTELAEDTSDWPYAAEWNYHRRIVGRLVTEGHEGRRVVLKGDTISGFWDTLPAYRPGGQRRERRCGTESPTSKGFGISAC